MSYPPASYPGYPPATPAYPAGYDPRSAPYGYPPPADPAAAAAAAAAAPQAPADPYAAYASAYPQPQAQPAGPAPTAPQTAPAGQPPQAGPAPAAPAPDPYAQAHYDYYRQYYAHYPPPVQPGYPPAAAPTDPHQSQQAPPAAHPGAPPAQAHAAPPSYPAAPAQTPPAHGAPPTQPEYPPAAYPPPAYPGYPGYDPSRPPDPYAHYAHYPPPAYPGYPHPPPGYPPPYAYPPPTHAHPPPAAPPQDRDRDRDRDRRPRSPPRDRKRDSKPPPRPEKRQKVEPDARAKLYQHVQNQKGWNLFWLEGIDPPTRAITNPNVTMLILTKGASGPASSFGFLMASSRQPQKLKDRQRECMKDLLVQVEQLLAGKAEADLRSWCQVQDSQAQGTNGSSESQESDLEKLKSTVASRLTSTGSKSAAVDLQMTSPSSCVIVSAFAFNESESREDTSKEKRELPDLAAMSFFSADAAAQLEEAHKLGGLLRLQWHFAVVKATRETKDDKESKESRPLALGIGFATDEALSKARALRTAEVRAEVLSEAMFKIQK